MRKICIYIRERFDALIFSSRLVNSVMKQARKNKVEKSSFIEYDEQLLEESDSIETIIEWAYQNFEKWLPSKRDDKNIKVLIQLTWEQET